MFHISKEEYKLLKKYKAYLIEHGVKNDIFEEKINECRRSDGAAEKSDERNCVPFTVEEIDFNRFPNAFYPSAETTYFSKLDDSDEEMIKLKEILSLMTEIQKDRIYLRAVCGMSFVEIAEMENVSPQTVRESYYRGIAHLRKYGDFLQSISNMKWMYLFK